MKHIISTGLAAASIALTGCSNTEMCASTADLHPGVMEQIDRIAQSTHLLIVQICMSHDNILDGKRNVITADGSVLSVQFVGDQDIIVTDTIGGVVTTITDTKNGSYTSVTSPVGAN